MLVSIEILCRQFLFTQKLNFWSHETLSFLAIEVLLSAGSFLYDGFPFAYCTFYWGLIYVLLHFDSSSLCLQIFNDII